ncbi:MAG: hypothetical protein U1F16_17315 [Turneriella sp.]
MPETIKGAIDYDINKSKLFFFLGAGVARLTGCPGWAELGANIIKRLREVNKISFKDSLLLGNIGDVKLQLSAIQALIGKEPADKAEFLRILHEQIDPKHPGRDISVYEILFGLPAFFLTTNADYDFNLDKNNREQFFFGEFLANKQTFSGSFEKHVLCRLHGSVTDTSDSDNNSLVFTIPHYVANYREQHSMLNRFLQATFSQHDGIFVFIGYGLSEIELLHYVLPKPTARKTVFWLKPYLSTDQRLYEIEFHAYTSMGITILPYSIDEIGHAQLVEVLRDWHGRLKELNPHSVSEAHEIDRLIQAGDYQKCVVLAKQSDELFSYFFTRPDVLTNAADVFPYLSGLLGQWHGYLPGKAEPEGSSISAPLWPPLNYIEHLARGNLQKPRPDITRFLTDFLQQLRKRQKAVDTALGEARNFRTDYFAIRIVGFLPTHSLNKSLIRLIFECSENDYGGQSSLLAEHISPRLLQTEDSDLIGFFVENLLKPRPQERAFSLSRKSPSDFHCILGEYYLARFYETYSKEIVAKYANELQRIIIKHIRAILKKNEFYFRHWHVVSIDNNVEMRSPNQGAYNYVLSDLLRDASMALSLKNVKLIESYFEEPEKYFHRLALHVISKNYAHLSDIFWRHYELTNPIDDLEIKPELFALIRDNCKKFSAAQISMVIEWIENANRPYYEKVASEEGIDKVEKTKAYDKLEWYEFALKRLKNDNIAAKIKQLKKIAPWKREIPAGFSSGPIKTRFGSPTKYTHTQLAALPIAEAVRKIMGFKGIKGPSWDKPTEEGLGDHIQAWANTQSKIITENLSLFAQFKVYYKTRLLYGLRTAISDGKEVHWQNLIHFLDNLSRENGFWEAIRSPEKAYSAEYALLGALADILYEASNSERQLPIEAVSESLPPIILMLLEKNPLHIDGIQYRDVISEYINHPSGKCWEAAVRCWALLARHRHKNPQAQVSNTLRDFFLRRMHAESLFPEEFIGLAMVYVMAGDNDPELSEKIMSKVFKVENNQDFNYGLAGVLFASRNIWIDLYRIFRREGVLQRAIRVFDWGSPISDHLIAYFAWGYFYGEDAPDNNDLVIRQFVEYAPVDKVERLAWFVWSQADEIKKKLPDRILPLWQLVNDRLKSAEKAGGRTASYMLNWLVFYEHLNQEITETAKQTIRYFQDNFSFSQAIEYFDDHWEQNEPYVVNMLKEIYDRGFVPTYPTEKIKSLLSKILESKFKRDGQEICRLYLQARIFDFQDVCSGPK